MISFDASSNGVAIALLVGLCLLFVWLAFRIAITVTKIAIQKRRLIGTRFIVSKGLTPSRPIKMEMQGMTLTLESDDSISAGSWAKVVSIKGNKVKVAPSSAGVQKTAESLE